MVWWCDVMCIEHASFKYPSSIAFLFPSTSIPCCHLKLPCKKRFNKNEPPPHPPYKEMDPKSGRSSVLTHLQVSVEAIERITPAQHTANTTLFLSNIDQIFTYCVETIFFFPRHPEKKVEHVHNTLKEALRKVLVPYYFMAGRLKVNEAQRRLEVDCNGAGVFFASAKSELGISEMGDINVPNFSFRNLILLLNSDHNLAETPLLTIQVTQFKCGGFTLGLRWNHAMMDGISVGAFLINFASVARQEGLEIIPDLDRSALKARYPLQPSLYELIMHSIPQNKSHINMMLGRLESFEGFNKFALSNHIHKVFPFSFDMINALKHKVLQKKLVSKCSTFEILTAHLWQTRTKALEMEPNDASPLFFAVDIRNKVIPPLGKGYAGNALVVAFTSMQAKELGESDLSYCVQKIQDAKEMITNEYVRSWTDWYQVHRTNQVQMGGFYVSTWSKFGFNDLDFGWGRASYAIPVPNDQLVNVDVLIPNGKRDGGLNVIVRLKPHQMDLFEQDIYYGI